jgi:hypothetical protein
MTKLLPHDTAQGCFNGLGWRIDQLPQRLIDQRLVIAAAGVIYLLVKPGDDVVVQTDGDARLAGRHTEHRTALGVRELVLLTHRRLPRS